MKSDEIRTWGRRHSLYEDHWLHSNVKNMAYFYTHSLFFHLETILQGDTQ